MPDTVKVRYIGPGDEKRTMLVTIDEADRLIKTGLWEKVKAQSKTTTTGTVKKETKNG